MQQVLLSLLAILGKSLFSMATSLLTADFLENLIIICLQKIAKKTDTDFDDKLLASLQKKWAINETSPDQPPSDPSKPS